MIGVVTAQNRNDTTFAANSEGVTNRTSAERWSAGTCGCRQAARERAVEIRREIKTAIVGGRRSVIVPWCVRETTEGSAVAAGKTVRY
jgi:hypothetical protein